MRRILIWFVVATLTFAVAAPASAQCVRIKDGGIFDANGNELKLGYDVYGYNYQARMFNGLYPNYARPIPPATEHPENLIMKWSQDWLANDDCNGDGKLDRGANGVSQGWLTNHIEGDYQGDDGEMHHYTYFVKIVWVGPAPSPDPWAGKRIWVQYAVIEEVWNDPYTGKHGVDRSTLVNPAGFGFYAN